VESQAIKPVEVKYRMVGIRAWNGGNVELLVKGYDVSVRQEEYLTYI
jgi:hypothetical protein